MLVDRSTQSVVRNTVWHYLAVFSISRHKFWTYIFKKQHTSVTLMVSLRAKGMCSNTSKRVTCTRHHGQNMELFLRSIVKRMQVKKICVNT